MNPIPEPSEAQCEEIAICAARYRNNWNAKSPPDPVRQAAEHPKLAPFLLSRLLVEEFRCRHQNSRPLPIEPFLAEFPGVERSPALMLDLIFAEATASAARYDVEDFVDRFPDLEKEIRERLSDSHTALIAEQAARQLFGSMAEMIDSVREEDTSWSKGQEIKIDDTYQLIDRLRDESGNLLMSGFKNVWTARQASTGRTVALKVPRFLDQRIQEILAEEAKLISQLEHQNIPPLFVLHAPGNAAPVLAEKFIIGEPWSRLLAKQKTERDTCAPERRASIDREHLRSNIAILQDVCKALAYAHGAHAIIHRDIKPDNVLLGAYGEVYLIDWGLAVQVGEEAKPQLAAPHRLELRAKGEIGPAGTSDYWAPEMVTADHAHFSPATDVFLLGAVLYHLLTGIEPYRLGLGDSAKCAAASEAKCPPPAERAPGRAVPPELEHIWRKACSKLPSERYADAAEFSAAVAIFQRIASAELVVAAAEIRLQQAETQADEIQQQSWWKRTKRRQSRLAVMTPLAEVADEFRIAAKEWEALPSDQQGAAGRMRALALEGRARMKLGSLAKSLGDYGVAEAQLRRTMDLPEIDRNKCEAEMASVNGKRRRRGVVGFTAYVTTPLAVLGFSAALLESEKRQSEKEANSLKSKHLDEIRKMEAASNEAERVGAMASTEYSLGHLGQSAAFQSRAIGYDNITKRWPFWQESIQQNFAVSVANYRISPGRTAWTASGSKFISGEPFSLGRILVWSADSGKLEISLEGHPEPDQARGELTCIRGLAADPKKESIVFTCGIDGFLQRTDIDTKEAKRVENEKTVPLTALDAIYPTGSEKLLLITGDNVGRIKVWDAGSLEPTLSCQTVEKRIVSLDVSPDGQWVAFNMADQPVRILNLNSQKIAKELALEDKATVPASLAFSPDGQFLAGGVNDGSVAVWKTSDWSLAKRIQIHQKEGIELPWTRQVAWRSNQEIVTTGADGVLAITNLVSGEPSRKITAADKAISGEADIRFLAVSPDGKQAYLGDASKQTSIWNLETLKPRLRSEGPMVGSVYSGAGSALHRGRNLLAAASLDNQTPLRILDATTLRVLAEIRVGLPAWDGAAPLKILPSCLNWSPDGNSLAVAFTGGLITWYDISADSPPKITVKWQKQGGHGDAIQIAGSGYAVPAISLLDWKDNQTLVSAGPDHHIRSWRAAGREPIADREWSLPGTEKLAADLIFGKVEPGGSFLVAFGAGKLIYRIPLDTNDEPVVAPATHRQGITALDITADGKRLISGDRRGEIIEWEWIKNGKWTPTSLRSKVVSATGPINLTETDPMFLLNRNGITSLRYSADGEFAAAALGDRTVTLMDTSTLTPINVVQAPSSVSGDPMPMTFTEITADGAMLILSKSGEITRRVLNPLADAFLTPWTNESRAPDQREIVWQPDAGQWFGRPSYGIPWEITSMPDGQPDFAKVKPLIKKETAALIAIPGGRLLLAENTGTSHVWDIKAKKIASTFEPPKKYEGRKTVPKMVASGGTAAAVSPDGKLAATASSAEDAFYLWEIATGKLVQTVQIGSFSGNRRVENGKFNLVGIQPINYARALAFHPTEATIAVVQDDGKLSLWNIADGQRRWEGAQAGPHCDRSEGLAFSPDGKHIIHAGNAPGDIHVWNARDGKLLGRLKSGSIPTSMLGGITARVNRTDALEFLPAKHFPRPTFASGGADGMVRVWELGEDGHYQPLIVISPISSKSRLAARELAEPEEDLKDRSNQAFTSQGIINLAASPDGKWLVGCNMDGAFTINLPKAMQVLRPEASKIEALTRDLTGYELDKDENLKFINQVRLYPVEE